MLVLAGYLGALRLAPTDEIMPPSRKRIRTCSGWVTMITVPVIACGFGVVPPSQTRVFVLVWTAGVGLLGIVLVLACLDLADSWRMRRAALRAQRERMAMARRRALDAARPGLRSERRDALRLASPADDDA